MAKFEFLEWLEAYLSKQTEYVFEWDFGNKLKNSQKHDISNEEIEASFYDETVAILGIQIQPLHNEHRFGVVGSTPANKTIFTCFTIRHGKIRVISARFASKQERNFYAEVLRQK